MGEKAAASRTAIHRSDGSSAVKAAIVAVPSLPPRTGGNGTPALGGIADRRSAAYDTTDIDGRLDVGKPEVELLILLDG